MSDKTFLDTNILIYAFDANSPAKRTRARSLMEGGLWTVSWQVIQEFSNIALRRFQVPLTAEDLDEYIELMLWPRCAILPSLSVYRHALKVHRQTQYSFYDSLIVTAALASGATILYSEDLQHLRQIDTLTIINPFRTT